MCRVLYASQEIEAYETETRAFFPKPSTEGDNWHRDTAFPSHFVLGRMKCPPSNDYCHLQLYITAGTGQVSGAKMPRFYQDDRAITSAAISISSDGFTLSKCQ